ncbi:hypothetical protein [Listeria phage vB_Lmo_2389_typeII]
MLKLREYQQEIINDVKGAFLQGYNRPCVVAPCG